MKNFEQIDVENLLLKIEKFYKLFYINKLVKGLIVSFGIILTFLLAFDALFYFGDLSDLLRFSLFYLGLVILIITVYRSIIYPIFKLFKLTKGISQEDASRYIGKHYPEIGDKLLNTLQFKELAAGNVLAQETLVQRSIYFQSFDFSLAVPSVRADKRIFLFLAPVVVLLGILIFNAKIVTEGSNRLVNFKVDFAAIAPFEFDVNPKNVGVFLGSDVNLNVRLVGEQIPDQVFIELNGIRYRTDKTDSGFEFILKNISHQSNYSFVTGKFSSESYVVQVNPLPIIQDLEVLHIWPSYLNRPNEMITNTQVIEVIEGSVLKWRANITNTQEVLFFKNNIAQLDFVHQDTWWSCTYQADYDFVVGIQLGKEKLVSNKEFESQVFVIKDEFPKIEVQTVEGAVDDDLQIFIGNVQDDFGFSSLRVKISNVDTSWVEFIPINKNATSNVFKFKLDKRELSSTTNLVFVVADNDLPHGYKRGRTSAFIMDIMSLDDLEKSFKEERDELISNMKILRDKSILMAKELDDVSKELLENKTLGWDENKKLEKLLNDRKVFKKDLENLKMDLNVHMEKSSAKNSMQEELLQKQEQLNKLFEKLMDEKSKELYAELQALLKELNKDKIQEHLDKMKMNEEDLAKELDLNLEIFKQMEVEREFEKTMEKLDDLAKKQMELSKKDKSNDLDKSLEDQTELSKEFEEIKKELQNIDSLNAELKDPNELDIDKEKQDEISAKQEESEKDLENEDVEKSSENQKDAAEKMEELQEKLDGGMSMSSSNQKGEDLEALRKILENLLVLSFEQEELMNEIRFIDKTDPRVVVVNQRQKQLLASSQMVKDSLYALASRVPQIEHTVTKEIKSITRNMDNVLGEVSERKLAQAGLYQQKSLTSINNLAVLLDEIIQQLQEQKKKKNSGSGSCSKPGEGKPKPSLKSSKKKQEELAKQMEALKKKLAEGKKPGQKPGKSNPGSIGKGMSKKVAEMAAQQELIRQEIRKIRDQLSKEGKLGSAGELKALEELLNKNQEDLINLDLDHEFFKRQQDIEVKMLEAVNANREREKEKKRESERAINYKNNQVQELTRYKETKMLELELLRIFNPNFSGYYKGKVQEYNIHAK